ncbi:oligoendopeptidase F [Ureaplasma diversum]|uniref:Oligopeptidase F n=1 Tax=Ureaplasma diversum TaxID=42094 RepID=A0A0C5RL04_9BACT|nr:oligoendopeptidase F [Ureaplasma diversum]AJQ45097.1 oligoendopeptidase F [Ureaplasma diversum]
MDNKYEWDLEHLLNNKSVDDLFEEYKQAYDKLISLYANFLDDVNSFKAFLVQQDQCILISNRLVNYVNNKQNIDLINPEYNKYAQKLAFEQHQIEQHFNGYDVKILANRDLIQSYLDKDPEIKPYQLSFDALWRYAPYTLNQEQEALLHKAERHNAGFEDIFDVLLSSDMKYDDVLDANNKVIKLNNDTDIYKHMRSKDRVLRKNVYTSSHKALYNLRNTFTRTLFYQYTMNNSVAVARNFKDYISSAAFADEVEVSLIQFIYEQTKLFKPYIIKFAKQRDKYLKYKFNLDKVYNYDRSLDLVAKKVHFSIEQAQSIVKDALACMGEQYLSVINKALNEHWVSWLPTNNKQTGAYSISGTKGFDKIYIFMNYDYTYNGVLTIAHELGHSVHTYYANLNQPIYNEYSIFYAEIASMANEVLVNYHLLDKYQKDDQKRLMILDEMISGFINTSTRQVAFSNFEWIANDWVNKGEEFSWEKVRNTYLEMLNQYSGYKYNPNKITKTDEDVALTIISVPHFYTSSFYVYKYAIGQIGGLIAASNIFNKQPNALDNMFKFFASGGSLNSLETIKLLGFDLLDKSVWNQAVDVFANWVNQFIKLTNKLMKS